MKEYIFVLEDKGTPFSYYGIIKADNEKEAVIKFIEHWGGIDIFTPERLNELIDSFNTFELIKLYESKHRRVIQFGEFNAIYGIPSKENKEIDMEFSIEEIKEQLDNQYIVCISQECEHKNDCKRWSANAKQFAQFMFLDKTITFEKDSEKVDFCPCGAISNYALYKIE